MTEQKFRVTIFAKDGIQTFTDLPKMAAYIKFSDAVDGIVTGEVVGVYLGIEDGKMIVRLTPQEAPSK